jgi:2-oxoglutarate ferredoxin oxidoreductase subunit alpha
MSKVSNPVHSTNDFVVHIATVNGSGSQSANNVLVKTFFRMGLPVAGKNLFPSNIQGLPTWFTIRVSEKGHLSRRSPYEVVVAMNPATFKQDIRDVLPGGFFVYNKDLRIAPSDLRSDVTNLEIPFKDIVQPITDSIHLKKLLTNMSYVGVLAHLFKIDISMVEQVIKDQFNNKASVVEPNVKALRAGYDYAVANVKAESSIKCTHRGNLNDKKILIDGNTAAGLGFVYGGCSFTSWYPITPSSSLVEAFEKYANKLRKDKDGKNTFTVVQAEDELSAISMVIGAGWAGARAMTATSGPGMSLMSEAAGLSYFAEIPAVLWNVQRVGPSTGLPTRTMQGDLLSASQLSHGDTKHVLLLPGTAKECFDFARTSLDLAEKLQTLVIVLSDLDLGMNLWMTDELELNKAPLERGKVLGKEDLKDASEFARYKDVDGDGIPYRTLPGTHDRKAAYFTRGTGHDETSKYTEDNVVFKTLLQRLSKKFETAKSLVPQPILSFSKTAKVGFIGFGSSDPAIEEARQESGIDSSYLRLRAYPFTAAVEKFIEQHETVFVVEQNRDRQLFQLLLADFPHLYPHLKSIHQYDGLPLEGVFVASEAKRILSNPSKPPREVHP